MLSTVSQDASFALDELTGLNKNDPNHILTGTLELDHVGRYKSYD